MAVSPLPLAASQAYAPFTPAQQVPTLSDLHAQKMRVQQELGQTSETLNMQTSATAFMRSQYFTAIVVAAITMFLLFALRPPIVRIKEDDSAVSLKKVLCWALVTGGLTLLIPIVCRMSGLQMPKFLGGAK